MAKTLITRAAYQERARLLWETCREAMGRACNWEEHNTAKAAYGEAMLELERTFDVDGAALSTV